MGGGGVGSSIFATRRGYAPGAGLSDSCPRAQPTAAQENRRKTIEFSSPDWRPINVAMYQGFSTDSADTFLSEEKTGARGLGAQGNVYDVENRSLQGSLALVGDRFSKACWSSPSNYRAHGSKSPV